MSSHLKPGTKVRLTRELAEDEHACPGLVLPEGCEGVLVEECHVHHFDTWGGLTRNEDGDIGFRPLVTDRGFETWCCFLDRKDYEVNNE